MSMLDDQLREKGVIEGAVSYIPPESITNVEIADQSIPTGDIANNAVTEDKIATAACGNGVAGGGGTVLSVDVDGAGIEIAANKVNIKAQGVALASLAADTKGTGLVAGGGTICDVNYDDASVNVDGSDDLQIKALGVTYAKCAATAKRHVYTVPLKDLVNPGPVRDGLLVCPTGRVIIVRSITIACHVLPTVGAGAANLLINKWDIDAGPAADVLVVNTFDCTTIATADTAQDLTVITAASANILAAGDFLHCAITLAGAVTQQWTGQCVSIEYEESSV